MATLKLNLKNLKSKIFRLVFSLFYCNIVTDFLIIIIGDWGKQKRAPYY